MMGVKVIVKTPCSPGDQADAYLKNPFLCPSVILANSFGDFVCSEARSSPFTTSRMMYPPPMGAKIMQPLEGTGNICLGTHRQTRSAMQPCSWKRPQRPPWLLDR